MPELSVSAPARQGILKRKIIPGTVVALAVLGALEVALRIIADGHPDPNVRLYTLAFSLGAGALAGGLRGSGAAAMLLALGLTADSAEAADVARQYNVTISSAACPTGTPGLLYDLKEPGMSLTGVRAWNLTVCPTSGETFTGVGKLKACMFRWGTAQQPGPAKWALSPFFEFDMTGITSIADNPCVTFPDVPVGVNDGDLLYIYPTTDLGVSGGAAISVYLEGVRP